MMDLVILGIFAFWIGKNFDGFDLDFSQNQDSTTEEPSENIPAKFTEWTMIREQPNRYGTTCSLWERQYRQGDVILWSQYQIRVDGQVFRSGYRDEQEALAEWEKTVRPYRDGELEDLKEIDAQKNFQVHTMYSPKGQAVTVTTYEQHLEYESLGYTHEKPPAQPLTYEDYSSSKGGVF